MEVWNLRELVGFRSVSSEIHLGKCLNNGENPILRLAVRILIDDLWLASGLVRINQQLKSLEQAIVANVAACQRKVTKKLGWLNPPINNFAELWSVDGASSNPIGGIATIAVPPLQVEETVILSILPIPGDEQADQFVAEDR